MFTFQSLVVVPFILVVIMGTIWLIGSLISESKQAQQAGFKTAQDMRDAEQRERYRQSGMWTGTDEEWPAEEARIIARMKELRDDGMWYR